MVSKTEGGGAGDRKARLAEELRANLMRRKAQAKSRRAGGADERPDGLGKDRNKPANPPQDDNTPAKPAGE